MTKKTIILQPILRIFFDFGVMLFYYINEEKKSKYI
jgi:hypothetical protein